MRVVWGCQSCQSNLLTLSYHFLQKMTGLSFILDSLVIFTNFHTHSYHTLKKKTFDYVWYYCICKYPIRKFCTPIHYIICNIYLWGFFSVDWMAPHSLEMRKSFLMKCSSGTLQNLSYFELKNPVIFSFRIPKWLQFLKIFAGTFHQASSSFFWRVCSLWAIGSGY